MRHPHIKSWIILFILLIRTVLYGQHPCQEKSIHSRIQTQHRLKNQNQQSPEMDISYYNLHLNLTNVPEYFHAKVTIHGTVNIPDTEKINLNCSDNLFVDSVLVNNIPVYYEHQNDYLTMHFEDIKDTLSTFKFTIYYRGKSLSDSNWGLGVFEKNNITNFSTMSEPWGAREWFPCHDIPGDKADSSDIWVTCKKHFTAVSNGSFESVTDNQDDTKTWHWKNHYPIATYLMSISLAEYEEVFQYFKYSDTDSMPIQNYLYPNQAEENKQILEITPNALKIFSELFGLYPFIKEKYGHAQFSNPYIGGMEHQTISSMRYFNKRIIIHELAHQWFGDKITCENFHHIWLNEGFATYCEALYEEITEGREGYKAYMKMLMSHAREAWNEGSVYVDDTNDVEALFNYYTSYAKGASILHMLRGVIGDSLFFEVLHSYANTSEFEYAHAITEDFQQIAETISRQDLEFFFDEWIYGENHPVYDVIWSSEKASPKGYHIEITINQDENNQPAFFTMPVNIQIQMLTMDTTITVLNNQQSQSWTLLVQSPPVNIVFDPDNWILKEMHDVLYIKNGHIANQEFRLFQNHPNPFNNSTNISYYLPHVDDVSIEIYDANGRLIDNPVHQMQNSGLHRIQWHGRDNTGKELPSGMYIVTIYVGQTKYTQKMMLVR